jgi:hypothetical protein
MSMPFHELRYWNEWHEIMAEEERRSVDRSKKKG